MLTHLMHVLGPPNGIAIGSAVFEGHFRVTNSQTHIPRYVWHLSRWSTSMLCMRCDLIIVICRAPWGPMVGYIWALVAVMGD